MSPVRKAHQPTAPPPVWAKVLSYDPRKGTASVITQEEIGRKLKIPWEVLKQSPPLELGAVVRINFDVHGFVSGIHPVVEAA